MRQLKKLEDGMKQERLLRKSGLVVQPLHHLITHQVVYQAIPRLQELALTLSSLKGRRRRNVSSCDALQYFNYNVMEEGGIV